MSQLTTLQSKYDAKLGEFKSLAEKNRPVP